MLFFLFSQAVSLEIDTVCPIYECGQIAEFTCVNYNQETNTNQIQSCPEGLYCPFNYTDPDLSIACIPTPESSAYPGEACNNSLECLYGECLPNKTCSGYVLGAQCDDTYNCAPGLYCKSSSTSDYSVCAPLIPAGQRGCTHSEDCSNLAYCNFTGLSETSFCQASLSFRAGTKVTKCYNGINYICENLFCVDLPTGSFCTSQVPTIKNLPVACTNNRDCMSQSDPVVGTFFIGNCTCGINGKGTSFCPLFPGDPAYQNYIFYLNLWMNSEEIMFCNSKRSMNLPCIKTYLDPYMYNTLVYYMYMVTYYPTIQNNPSCVQQTINTIYWESEEYMASQEISSLALALSIVGVFYLG